MSQTPLSERLRALSKKGWNQGRFNKDDVDTLEGFAREADRLISREPQKKQNDPSDVQGA